MNLDAFGFELIDPTNPKCENMLRYFSVMKGIENAPDDLHKHTTEKVARPSPHELELASRQDRSPKRRRLMAEFFREVATQVTQFEKDALKIFGLPDIDKVRAAAVTGDIPDDEKPWAFPDGVLADYKRRVVELGIDLLGDDLYEKAKALDEYAGIEGIVPYQEFNAFAIGIDETYEQLLRKVDPGSLDESRLRRERARATKVNPYYKAVVSDGAKRVKTRLALSYMDDVITALKRMAKDGKGPIAAGHALHNEVGEGALWYWMRITRSESALAINAGFNYTQQKYGVPYERWSAGPGACEICQYFGRAGSNIWPTGTGPQPIVDTHPHCLCHKDSVYVILDGQTPQPAWGRTTPYDQPYTERERRGMEIMNEEADKYRRRKQ